MTVVDHQDPAVFRAVLGHYPTGVAVVTAMTEDGPVGMTVGTFTSISLDPPLVGFFPGRSSGTWARIREAGAFCANVLGAEHHELSRNFAAREADRFTEVLWTHGPTSSPVLTEALAWVDCAIDEVRGVGDHQLVVGRVVGLGARDDGPGRPLVFHRGRYGSYMPVETTTA